MSEVTSSAADLAISTQPASSDISSISFTPPITIPAAVPFNKSAKLSTTVFAMFMAFRHTPDSAIAIT